MKNILIICMLLTILPGLAFLGFQSFLLNETATGSIPHQIGEKIPVPSILTKEQPFTKEEVYKKTGYHSPTNKGFKGMLMVSPISLFTLHQPGDKEGTYISGVPDGMRARVQLVERTPDLEKIRLIKEKIYEEGEGGLVVTLPEKRDVFYSVSAELLDGSGRVVDTIVGIVYVTKEPQINARISVDKDIYHPEEQVRVTIENSGYTSLSFGEDFRLDMYDGNGRWVEIPLPDRYAVPDIAYSAMPLRSYTIDHSLDIFSLDEGTYRIVKTISVPNQWDLQTQLAAEFEVMQQK